jgi:hypothetical protein
LRWLVYHDVTTGSICWVTTTTFPSLTKQLESRTRRHHRTHAPLPRTQVSRGPVP